MQKIGRKSLDGARRGRKKLSLAELEGRWDSMVQLSTEERVKRFNRLLALGALRASHRS
jgi:hypothetical protein